ncbi:MAG: hypothetical protein AAFY60_02095, partial [Myxococcota bacterium]
MRPLMPTPDAVIILRPVEGASLQRVVDVIDALKAGDITVEGAADYGAFTDDIFPIESEPEAVAQYPKDRGFPDNARDFVQNLRSRLER